MKNDFVNEFEERDILGFSQLEVQEVSEKKLKAKIAMKLKALNYWYKMIDSYSQA